MLIFLYFIFNFFISMTSIKIHFFYLIKFKNDQSTSTNLIKLLSLTIVMGLNSILIILPYEIMEYFSIVFKLNLTISKSSSMETAAILFIFSCMINIFLYVKKLKKY